MDFGLLFFLSVATINMFSGVQPANIEIINNCPYTIWPATLTGGGGAQLPNTGFELAPKRSSSIDIPPRWSGRFWARSLCTIDPGGSFYCETADCGSGQTSCNGAGADTPATLVEFTFGGYGGKDFYDVSLVDGFNLPVSVAPYGVSGTATCTAVACTENVNAQCPAELALKDSAGATIGCKSACLSFKEPQFCCTGGFSTPETCPPTNYSSIFKSMCPQAYSYAYDDSSSTFTCAAAANYIITFCPSQKPADGRFGWVTGGGVSADHSPFLFGVFIAILVTAFN